LLSSRLQKACHRFAAVKVATNVPLSACPGLPEWVKENGFLVQEAVGAGVRKAVGITSSGRRRWRNPP
jgi:hypothetical protein